jgi:hypothetical protein
MSNYLEPKMYKCPFAYVQFCFTQNSPQVSPLRQDQGTSDSSGCHGEEVWGSREKMGRKSNSGEMERGHIAKEEK